MSRVYRTPITALRKRELQEHNKDTPHTPMDEWLFKYVNSFLEVNECTEFLDYGCGTSYLKKYLPQYKVHEYDPGYEEKSADPSPCSTVLCLNVLQYCEEKIYKQTLWHLQNVVKERGVICVGLGNKDGYLMKENSTFWTQWLSQFFTIHGKQLVTNALSAEPDYLLLEVSPIDFTVIPLAPFSLR